MRPRRSDPTKPIKESVNVSLCPETVQRPPDRAGLSTAATLTWKVQLTLVASRRGATACGAAARRTYRLSSARPTAADRFHAQRRRFPERRSPSQTCRIVLKSFARAGRFLHAAELTPRFAARLMDEAAPALAPFLNALRGQVGREADLPRPRGRGSQPQCLRLYRLT